MIAMTPGDDAWGFFFVSVYHYQAGRERGGPPTPVHHLSLEMSCHDLEADPCPPVFRKNFRRPLSTGGMPTRVYLRKS